MAHTLVSGAAIGADQCWQDAAQLAGHQIVNYIFEAPLFRDRRNSVILTDEQLAVGHAYVLEANYYLKRRYPTSAQLSDRLLQRNYYQIAHASSIYAVGYLDGSKGLGIHRGTAWAVTMFWLKCRRDQNILTTNTAELATFNQVNYPIYFFDQGQYNVWLQLVGLSDTNYQWHRCIPSKPTGIYTGIGSRDLTSSGRLAIESLLSQ